MFNVVSTVGYICVIIASSDTSSPRAPFLTALGLTFTMHTMALRANSTIPITQTVTIDGVEVYSQGSGHDSLNQ